MADLLEIGYVVTETGTGVVQQKLAALEQQANRTAGVGAYSNGFGGLGKAITDAANAASRTEKWERIGQAIGTELRGAVDSATGSLGGLGNILSAVGPWGLAAAAGIGALTAALVIGLKDASEYQQAIASLENSLIAAGNSTGFTEQRLKDFAAELEDATLFTEEQILKTEAIINQYGLVAGNQFKEVTRLALDMAQQLGTDPVDAARSLMRALQDPDQGLSQLRRSFSVLSPAIVDTVKEMVAAGDKAGALALIVDTLKSKVGGGSSRASNDTLAGAWSNASDALGDLSREMSNSWGITAATTNSLNFLSAAVNEMTGKLHRGAEGWAEWWRGASGGNAQGVANGVIADGVAAFQSRALAIRRNAEETSRAATFQQKFVDQLRAESGLGAKSANDRAIALAGEAAVQKALTEAKAHDIDVSKVNTAEIRKQAEEFKRLELQQTASWHAATKGAGEAAREAKRAQDELVHLLEEGSKGATKADANLKKYVATLKQQEAVAGLSNEEAERANALFQAQEQLLDRLGGAYRELTAEERKSIEASVEHRQALEEQKKTTEDLASGIGDAVGGLASDLEQSGASGKEALMNFIKAIVELIFKLYVLIPLIKELKKEMGGLDLFGGGAEDIAGSALSYGFERGGAFENGRMLHAAKGMVTMNRRVAPLVEFGEAGPEAIMPLKRMGDGRLGVSMGGGGAQAGGNVTVQNIDQRKGGQAVETQSEKGPNGETIIRNYIRDEIKKAAGDGGLDGVFGKNFGLRRKPVAR